MARFQLHHSKLIRGLLLSVAVFVVSCSNFAEQPDKAKTSEIVDSHFDDGIYKVGISMPSQYLERWNHDGQYLKNSFEELGYEVELCYAGNMIDIQIEDMENMIEDGVDVLIISAIDGLSLTKVIEKAHNNNIPVIAYDRLICNSEYVSAYISFDNYKVGTLQGEYIEAALNLQNAEVGAYNIEFTAGDMADSNARYFFDGAMDVLSPYIENGILNVPSGQMDFYTVATPTWASSVAKMRFDIILGSYYTNGRSLDAVVCSNDSTALGVLEAIDENYDGSNTIFVTGQDCDEENLIMLFEGRQSMEVYKNLSYEALVTVKLVDSILGGEEISKELTDKWDITFKCSYDEESYYNGKIYVPSFLLEPIAITKQNAIEELVDKYQSYVIAEDGNLKVAE